jgi:hypothetical protein
MIVVVDMVVVGTMMGGVVKLVNIMAGGEGRIVMDGVMVNAVAKKTIINLN